MNATARRMRSDSPVPLNEHPRWLAVCEEVATLEQRAAMTQQRAEHARARIRSKNAVLRSGSAEVKTAETLRHAEQQDAALALALAEGRELAVPLPPQYELEAAEEEKRLLTRLLNEARGKRDAVRAELDAEASAFMVAEQEAANPPLDLVIEALHLKYTAACAPSVKLLALGYRPNYNILPFFNLPHVSVIGNPDAPETIAGRFRKWLRDRSAR